MRLHQIVVSAAPRDAVTNAAMEIRKLLREIAPSEIFARNIEATLDDDVHPISSIDLGGPHRPQPSDLVIFHGSIGDPHVFDVVWELPCPVVLMYHNVSPAAAYRPYDVEFAELLRSGRHQIARLRQRVRGALAPSEFNAKELEAMGYPSVRVTPLIMERADNPMKARDQRLEHELSQVEGPLFLFVGQLLPHKRPDFLLQAFHILSTYLLPGAHLAMVGAGRLPMYRRRLDVFIQELSLPGLHFPGPVSDEALATYFDHAAAFVTASEHEGFCVPLIESMAAGVPIVARATTAVPGTLQGAGLCVDVHEPTGVFAEAMLEIVSNEPLRRSLIDRGQERARAFSPQSAKKQFLRNLMQIAV